MPFLSAGYEPFPKDDYSHCRTLFLIPYNREPLHILRTFIFYIPIPLSVFANRLYIVAVITVFLSLMTDACRTHKPGAEEKGGNFWPIVYSEETDIRGFLSDFVYQLCDLGIQFA